MFCRVLFLSCVVALAFGSALKTKIPQTWAVKDSGYAQLYSVRFTSSKSPAVVAWPALPFEPLQVVADTNPKVASGSFLIRSTHELHTCGLPSQVLTNNTGIPPEPLSCRSTMSQLDATFRVAVNATGGILVANGGEARWLGTNRAQYTHKYQFGAAVHQIAFDSYGTAWVAAAGGLFAVDAQMQRNRWSVRRVDNMPHLRNNCPAISVATRGATVAVGFNCTDYGMLVQFTSNSAGAASDFKHQFTPGVIDTTPRGLAFGAQDLWIADDTVHQQFNTTLKRFGPKQGLPRNGANHIAVTSHGTVWVGTDRGVLRYGARLHQKNKYWKALMGGRWLPGKLDGSPASSSFFDGQRVLSMAALSFRIGTLGPNGAPLIEAVAVVTDGGLAVLTSELFDLKIKAALLESRMRPRHLRFGLTDDADLKNWGDIYSWYGRTTDNDGLHTAGYILAEGYRYQATGNQEARTRGLDALEAMNLLNNVTGIKGYAARSVVKHLPPHVGGQWYPSKTVPGFIFKGNTSSDEITGHLAAYPICFDMLGSRTLAVRLHLNMMDYIMKNNYTLIGYNGQPTRWGNWNPYDANYDQAWEDERGLNAAELMGFLAAAYHMSGDLKYANAVSNLITKHDFATNLKNLKIDNPADYAFFDDHLGLMALRNLLYYWYGTSHASNIDAFIDDAVLQWYPRGRLAQLTPDIVLYAVWCAVSRKSIDPTDDIRIAVNVLEDWPLDTIAYPSFNQDRWDIKMDPETPGRLMAPLPRDEHTAMMWAHGGFGVNGGRGTQAANPKDFLMAYWMAVYHGVIV